MYLTSRPADAHPRDGWPADVELHPAIEQAMAVAGLRVRNLVDHGVEVVGPVYGAPGEVLLIRGLVRGAIDCEGGVVVAQGGRVTGAIKADFVQIAGQVEGAAPGSQIEANGVLVVMATGQLHIDACAASMHVVYGAGINGVVEHRAPEGERGGDADRSSPRPAI